MLDFEVNAKKPGKGWEPTPKRPLSAAMVALIITASFMSVFGFQAILDIPLDFIAHHRLFQLYGRKTEVLTVHSYHMSSCGYYRERPGGRPLMYLLREEGPWAEGISPPWSATNPGTRRWLNDHWASCYQGLSKGSDGSFLDPFPLWFINRFAN